MSWQPGAAPEAAGRVACIGAGVIGGGWVAQFLARGFDVRVWDPSPDARVRVTRLVTRAWPALEALGLAPGASLNRMTFAPSLDEGVAEAQFVQESAPERLDLKIRLLAEIDDATPPGTVIASSTSGYPMGEMAVEATRAPERLVVGHPFNPPYLIPLVEVVGGALAAASAVEWAVAFYERAGKSVITMDNDVPGFVGNRLQEALWREALHMVAAGEATVAQIDAAIREGPGLRWALMGPYLTFHLAGGDDGMAGMLDHFGPALLSPWTRLGAPPLTRELRDRVVAETEAEAAGRSIDALIRERDAGLVAILKARPALG
ncbi:MAG: 3-hydroxyacyl-CoA dehydrogenase NAD-binding domain-containing protein, partial [Alphaproteobacteria bacterium]